MTRAPGGPVVCAGNLAPLTRGSHQKKPRSPTFPGQSEETPAAHIPTIPNAFGKRLSLNRKLGWEIGVVHHPSGRRHPKVVVRLYPRDLDGRIRHRCGSGDQRVDVPRPEPGSHSAERSGPRGLSRPLPAARRGDRCFTRPRAWGYNACLYLTDRCTLLFGLNIRSHRSIPSGGETSRDSAPPSRTDTLPRSLQ